MKKFVIAIATGIVFTMFSCVGESRQENQAEQTDTTQVVTDSIQQVTGVAIDGAMNSVYLRVGEDTIEFNYPDLDSEHRASWEIDDTLTVRYYVTQGGDSVIQIVNQADA